MSAETCSSCCKTVRSKQQKLTCAACSKFFHRTCMEGISQDRYRAWRREGVLDAWTCSPCTDRATGPATPTTNTTTSPQPMEILPTTSTTSPQISPLATSPTTTATPPLKTSPPTTTASPMTPLGPLIVREVGDTFVTLAWMPFPAAGPGLLHSVTYKERSKAISHLSSNKIFELGEFLLCKVESLSADTEYMFYVDVTAGSGLTVQLATEDFVKTKSVPGRLGGVKATPSTTTTTPLLIETPPAACTSPPPMSPLVLPLKVEEVGENHVTLRWRATPTKSSSPQAKSHIITYKENAQEGILPCPNQVSKLGDFNLCKVDSLTPNTEYQFFVEVGDGTGAKQKLATTHLVRTKTAFVLPLKVEEVGEDHVKLRWKATPTKSSSEAFTHHVSYQENGQEAMLRCSNAVSMLGEFHLCKVDSLIPNTEYQFFVEVDYATGAKKKFATTHFVRTKAGLAVPSAPVGPLKALSIRLDSLILSWRPPLRDGNCRPLTYKVSYTLKDSSSEKPVSSRDMVRQVGETEDVAYKIGSLVPGTDYRFYVRAKNIVGDSEPLTSEGYISTDKIPVPAMGPLFVRHETSGIGSLRVWWPRLNEEIHRVDKYVVKASANLANFANLADTANLADWHTVVVTKDSSENAVHIVNQFPKSYLIGVAAVNSSGPGPMTIVRKEIKAPMKGPFPVTVKPAGPSKTKVTWNLLSANHNSVAKYVVKASIDKHNWKVVKETTNADSSLIIDNAFNNTHWIGVAAANDAGDGPLITELRELTAPVKGPDPVTLEPAGPGKTKITWGLLCTDTCRVTKYIVKTSVDKNVWTVVRTLKSTDTYVVIENVYIKNHWIGVAAANEVGTGPLTMVKSEAKEAGRGSRDMPDLPFFKVLEELVPVQDIDFNKSHMYTMDIPAKHKARDLRRLQDGLKVQLRFCCKGGPSSTKDEMPRNGLVAWINSKKVYPDPMSIDLTKKWIMSEPIDITAASMDRAYPTLTLFPVGSKEDRQSGRYCFCVRLVRQLTADDLCETLLSERLRPAQTTQDEVRAKLSGDDDCEIAATSVHASLLCPIAKTKLRYPCRSTHCSHVQCLDAVTMVTLNEKKSRWSCQVCSTPCTFADLYIDGLFKEILATVPADITDIEFSKDGSWTYKGDKSDKENNNSEETDMSIIELDLSKTLDMIDLTETDDENTPVKKKEKEPVMSVDRPAKLVEKLSKLGGDKSSCDRSRGDRVPSSSENESRQPLRTNNMILNAAFRVGQSVADFLGIRGERESRGLGENYQSSELSSCQRSSSSNNNRHRSKWARSNPYSRNRDWYHNRYNNNSSSSSSYRSGGGSGGGGSSWNQAITDYYYSDSRQSSNNNYYRSNYY